ncbi:sterol desaturase family protein [Myxococcus stipitatus]|uniref:sterol desaturase family protein n=1 Tax=Myxococcus stipitatus TaxID=83455 RepID=UPI0030CB38C1
MRSHPVSTPAEVSSSSPSLFSYLPYPVVFFGGTAALVAGLSQGLPYWRVGPPILLLAALLVLALERWSPHSEVWRKDHDGDTSTDFLHVTGNLALSHISLWLYTWTMERTGDALSWWPRDWPFWAQFLLGTAVLDLGLYGIHRASHHVPWLWRLHAIHHSPRRVYWLNGQRRHLIHEALEGAPGLLVMGLMGAPSGVVACALATVTLHLMFQHGNIAYRAGVLRHVFAVAELHRWHHQRLYADVQGNYGAILSVWDRLFGTALPQKGEAPLDVGMDDEPTLPTHYLGQLTWPFRRQRE